MVRVSLDIVVLSITGIQRLRAFGTEYHCLSRAYGKRKRRGSPFGRFGAVFVFPVSTVRTESRRDPRPPQRHEPPISGQFLRLCNVVGEDLPSVRSQLGFSSQSSGFLEPNPANSQAGSKPAIEYLQTCALQVPDRFMFRSGNRSLNSLNALQQFMYMLWPRAHCLRSDRKELPLQGHANRGFSVSVFYRDHYGGKLVDLGYLRRSRHKPIELPSLMIEGDQECRATPAKIFSKINLSTLHGAAQFPCSST